MGMAVGRTNSNRVRIELRNLDGSYAGSISYTKPSLKKGKHLQYLFKAISAQLMQAKTSGAASQVAARARRQVAVLQRNKKSGEYDQEELEIALTHAKSLERVARKRVRHLRQEEALKDNRTPYLSDMEEKIEETLSEGMDPEELLELSEEELKRLMEELQEAMQELEETQEVSQADPHEKTEELSDAVLEEMDSSMDLEQLKKKHRSDEMREIMEADMRYLKALFNKLAREKQEAASGNSGSSSDTGSNNNLSGVSLELAGMEMPVPAAEAAAPAEGGNMDVLV